MSIGRVIVRLIAACIGGGVATCALFLLVAWISGQLPSGIHSTAAFVLFLAPVAVGVVFWLLGRANFPEPNAFEESQ